MPGGVLDLGFIDEGVSTYCKHDPVLCCSLSFEVQGKRVGCIVEALALEFVFGSRK